MTSRKLRLAPEPFVAEFNEQGSLRQPVGESGRVHIDRSLPFLFLYRGPSEGQSLARQIAIEGPSYLVWDEVDDHIAHSALGELVDRLSGEWGRMLVLILDDRPMAPAGSDSTRLTPFVAAIGEDGSPGARRVAESLERSLKRIEIDLRRCKVERVPAAVDPAIPLHAAVSAEDRVDLVTLAIPPIDRRPDGGNYPGIRHDLSVAVGDALLRAACAYLDDGQRTVPKHYRSLGRSYYLAAARKADRKIDEIARSFDFLLSISPIDSQRAFDDFRANRGEKPPRFHYRPLTVDPDIAKRDLYAIDLTALEDPLLERLLAEKRREIDAQLTMLATRNTPSFRPASMFLYGAVDAPLLADARTILAATAKDPPRGATVAAPEIAAAAADLAARYRQADDSFVPEIQVRDDVDGLLVSGPRLMISSRAMMPARRLPALLAHEVGVHLLTYFNGLGQGLGAFSTGLAGYEGVQEGLGVFAEWAVGGLTRTRLRLLAARVVAVDAMLKGASFIDSYRILTRDHGFSQSGAFGICARVYRSGGLAKDAIYLQGFRAVIDLIVAGARLEPFWLGKIAVGHVAAIEELLQRGLVKKPRFTPLFLEEADTKARIARLREAGGIEQLWQGVS